MFTADIDKSPQCQPAIPPSEAPLAVLAWAIPVGVIGLAAIAAVVVMTVPSLRAKVFPFLQRRNKPKEEIAEELQQPAPAPVVQSSPARRKHRAAWKSASVTQPLAVDPDNEDV